MKIPKHIKTNHETLRQAMAANNICIMDVYDKAAGKAVVALCTVHTDKNSHCHFVPLAIMIDGNPFSMYAPPKMDGSPGYEGVEEGAPRWQVPVGAKRLVALEVFVKAYDAWLEAYDSKAGDLDPKAFGMVNARAALRS